MSKIKDLTERRIRSIIPCTGIVAVFGRGGKDDNDFTVRRNIECWAIVERRRDDPVGGEQEDYEWESEVIGMIMDQDDPSLCEANLVHYMKFWYYEKFSGKPEEEKNIPDDEIPKDSIPAGE